MLRKKVNPVDKENILKEMSIIFEKKKLLEVMFKPFDDN